MNTDYIPRLIEHCKPLRPNHSPMQRKAIQKDIWWKFYSPLSNVYRVTHISIFKIAWKFLKIKLSFYNNLGYFDRFLGLGKVVYCFSPLSKQRKDKVKGRERGRIQRNDEVHKFYNSVILWLVVPHVFLFINWFIIHLEVCISVGLIIYTV